MPNVTPTHDELIANIKAMETQGAQPQEIQQYLDRYKGQTPGQPMTIPQQQPLTPDQSSGALGNITNALGSFFGGVANTARGVATGAALGAAQTLEHADVLNTMHKLGGEKTLQDITGADITKVQPQGGAQQFGYGAERIGEFMAPMGAEKAVVAKGAELMSGLPKAAQIAGTTGLKAGTSAASMGTVAAGQGQSPSEIATSAELGGLGGALSAVKYAKGFLPDVLSFTSGIPKGAVAKAMENPEALKIGKDMSMAQIRDKAVTAVGALEKDMKTSFGEGLSSLQKRAPFKLGAFNNAKGFFKTALQDAKSGIPSIFRDYGVSVQEGGKSLDFEKLNSPIVKGSEQNNLQKALDTINRQTDFSPKGVERVAARLNALTKFGENNESSAIITRMKNAYSSAIEKGFPELGALRKQYGDTATKIGEIKDVIGTKFDSPKQIQSAVTRLTQIYNDDKETYLNTIKTLSDMTGTDFGGLIASDKFKQIMPAYVRGVGGGGAVSLGSAAVAHFLNPLYLLALPLFSPAAIGKGIAAEGAVPAAASAITRGGTAAAEMLNQPSQSGQEQQ